MAQITSFGIGPFVPDAYTVFLQIFYVGVALQKPKQFVYDGFQVEFFGGQQRESLLQIETHLMSEDTDNAGACTVVFAYSFLQNTVEQVKILFHVVDSFMVLCCKGTLFLYLCNKFKIEKLLCCNYR